MRTSLRELIGKGYVSGLAQLQADGLDAGRLVRLDQDAGPRAAEPGHEAEAEAAANVQFLRENGYCVNVARRPKVKRKWAKGSRPMVLVIDDDPDICSLLQMYLKLEGFESRVAGNREEVLAELRSVPLPDAVILDVHLPDADGFDILHRMREHPALKGLPILMLTGEATREAVLKGILGGADGFITKPFDIRHLVRAVKAVIGMLEGPVGQDWDLCASTDAAHGRPARARLAARCAGASTRTSWRPAHPRGPIPRRWIAASAPRARAGRRP